MKSAEHSEINFFNSFHFPFLFFSSTNGRGKQRLLGWPQQTTLHKPLIFQTRTRSHPSQHSDRNIFRRQDLTRCKLRSTWHYEETKRFQAFDSLIWSRLTHANVILKLTAHPIRQPRPCLQHAFHSLKQERKIIRQTYRQKEIWEKEREVYQFYIFPWKALFNTAIQIEVKINIFRRKSFSVCDGTPGSVFSQTKKAQ